MAGTVENDRPFSNLKRMQTVQKSAELAMKPKDVFNVTVRVSDSMWFQTVH